MGTNNSSSTVTKSSFGCGTMLIVIQISLIVLRAIEIIDASWWVVFIPAYIMALIALLFMAIAVLLAIISSIE